MGNKRKIHRTIQQWTIIVVSDFKFLFFVLHCVDTIFDIKFLNIILLYLIIHKLELHWFYLNMFEIIETFSSS
uniref:Ovule protein n=1 Tax=Heterorhabditis bacteriophora TaxID=37862 RepID=A0A1I7WKD2_HETBA